MKINIIDPSSTEFNRGSFCYSPYLTHNVFCEKGHDVNLIESFRAEALDDVPDADLQIVNLWSYPQIECAMLLFQFLPFMHGKNNVYFVGYTPLIQKLGLPHISRVMPDPLSTEEMIRTAMYTYPKYYFAFHRLLLSDCDMHLKHLDKLEKVYPLFTSYGCPNGCAFCPSTKNCGKKRVELSLEEVFTMLISCHKLGIRNIHFTDEDFFFDIDRAYEILRFLSKEKMHLIALSSADAAWRFIQKYGTNVLKEAGLEVMEIGFESAAEDVSQSMGAGKSLTDCQRLAEIQHTLPFDIFWLVMTFFPGETIRSLNETGRFMRKYGFEAEQVMGRLRTNGTKGGLGQFFQDYVGTSIHKVLGRKGIFLTPRPIRLMPSFVPDSFLDSIITEILPENMDSALPWLHIYNMPEKQPTLEIGKTIGEYIYGKDTVVEQMQEVLRFAIYARMEVIR